MKNIPFVLILLLPQFGNAQFAIVDTLITDSISFRSFSTKVSQIDSYFSNTDSITISINAKEEWNFICSRKVGWESRIGAIQNHRREFNDIRASPNDTTFFTTNELVKIFYLESFKAVKDSNGTITCERIGMTKNKKYLVVRLGHCYPNGNQTSWCYTFNYYFKRRLK